MADKSNLGIYNLYIPEKEQTGISCKRYCCHLLRWSVLAIALVVTCLQFDYAGVLVRVVDLFTFSAAPFYVLFFLQKIIPSANGDINQVHRYRYTHEVCTKRLHVVVT